MCFFSNVIIDMEQLLGMFDHHGSLVYRNATLSRLSSSEQISRLPKISLKN